MSAARASAAPSGSDVTTIPGVAGSLPLRVHARVYRSPSTVLPPIVFVHGFGIAASYALPLAEHLAAEADVYIPDLPGHGRSDHDVRPLTIPELASALVNWMHLSDLRAVTLVGHSLGCQVAAIVAADHPGLVAVLVLIGPTLDPAARSYMRLLWRTVGSLVFERPTLAMAALVDYSRAGPRVLLNELRQMRAHSLEELLPRISAPAKVIRGGRDRIAPQHWAERVATLLRAEPPTVIDGWGHAVHYDDPEAVAKAIHLTIRRHIAGQTL
jgi:pimeloyl-ACP methyl ester carboxylesterase